MRLPVVIDGMIEASTTRKPVDADHARLTVDDRHRDRRLAAHLAGAGGVKGALHLGADEGVDRRVASRRLRPAGSRGRDNESKAGCAKISRVSRTQARISVQSSGWLM